MCIFDLIEIQFADGTVKECYIKAMERYVGAEKPKGKFKKVLVEQRKFTAEEITRFE